jgi:hypothetical protein
VALAGCGSTVQVSSTSVNGAPAADGLTPPGTSQAPGLTPTTSAPTGSSPGRAVSGGTTGGSAIAVPSGSDVGVTEGAGGGVQGFGVTASTVTIGLPYSPGADAAAAQIGASSITSGDTKAVANAVIADINKRGGVLGRKLVPVYHEYDAASTQSVDQKYAEACADYVGDHRSFAVLDTGRVSFMECVTRKALVVSSDDYGFGAGDFVRYPYLVDTNTLALERAMTGWVRNLPRQQYFGSWDTTQGKPGTLPPVVGVLSVDYPAVNRAVESVLLPGLKAAGHAVKPDNYVKLANGNSTADAPRTVADIGNAVLRFQTNGVTHVILFDNAGGVTLFFGKAAANQQYYPRLGINTQNAMQTWLESGDLSAQQANGAVGLGWAPNSDLATADTGAKSVWSTPARTRCLDILRRNGINPPSHNAELIALMFCDRLFFVEHVMNRMNPKRVTREEFLRVVNGLGSGYGSPTLQQTRFGPAQHDGVSLGYDLRFVPACTCMRYAGKPFALS